MHCFKCLIKIRIEQLGNCFLISKPNRKSFSFCISVRSTKPCNSSSFYIIHSIAVAMVETTDLPSFFICLIVLLLFYFNFIE